MATLGPCTTGQQESVHRESAVFHFLEESAPGTVQGGLGRGATRRPSERDSEPPDDSCPGGAQHQTLRLASREALRSSEACSTGTQSK